MRIKVLVLLSLGILTSHLADAQEIRDTTLTVNFYGVADGLPNPDITAIFRDSFGLMWLGTDGGGLSYYDASRFFNYYPNSQITDSLSNGNITDIAEDSHHNIWLATQEGISCWDRSSLKFRNYPILYNTRDGIDYKGALALYVDEDDMIWVATMRGLLKFDGKTATQHWFDFPYILNQRNLYLPNKILKDKKGTIWVLVSGVLLSFDPERETYNRLDASSYELGKTKLDIITGFAFDRANRLCISTLNAVYIYRDAINFPYMYPLPAVLRASSFAMIEGFWLDCDDEPWVLYDGKMYCIDRESSVWTCIRNIYTQSEKIENVSSPCCNFENRDVFFFPIDGGFATWNRQLPFFMQSSNRLDDRSRLRSKKVLSIFTHDDRNVWVGTAEGMLLHLDFATDSIVNYNETHPLPFTRTHSTVNTFFRFPSGELVAGTSEGLLYFNPQNETWQRTAPQAWLQDLILALHDRQIQKIVSTDDDIFLFALRDGLFVYEQNNAKGTEVTSVVHKDVRDVLYESQHYILCVADNRLYRVDIKTYQLVAFTFSDTIRNPLVSSPTVLCVAKGTNERFWVGTDDGLYYLQAGDKICTKALEHNYFRFNSVNSLHCDAKGNVWIATLRGIAEFDPTAHNLYIFGKADGLRRTTFNRNAVYQSPNGTIYFGSLIGFTYFHPRDRRTRTDIPVILSRVELFSEHKHIMHPTHTTREILMPAEFQSISFYLSCLAYSVPIPPHYQVLFEGLYERWSDVTSGSVVSVNLLPPGRYKFRYRASLNNDVWVEGEPYTLIIEEKSSFASFFKNYLLIFTIIFFVIALIFVRRFLIDGHGKVNDRIRNAMHLEALNQDLQRQSRILNAELRSARHSQDVILPTLDHIRKRCPESFILFKPLREVSGYIYWYSEYKEYIYLGVVDCTGHGISAAIMSLISYVFLHTIIVEHHTTNAAKILSLLSNSLYTRNAHTEDTELVSEGADISICVVDTSRQMIDFAGAFQRIIHCHDHLTDVYIGDATFLGNMPNQNFTSRVLHYTPNDMLYLFSDGYADQIGGPYAKKMRFATFQELLESAAQRPTDQQQSYLTERLANWQGTNAQYDDITLLGFRCNFRTE